MAKISYKIPASINRSYMDAEINLSSGSMQVKPKPVKFILFWIGSFFAFFAVVKFTFVSSASLPLIILFGLWWIIMTAVMGTYGKTKEMKFMQIKPYMEYIPKSARRVITRMNSDPNPFATIVSIEGIDDDGLITWFDGSVGRMFLVVGSGSLLLFEYDRNMIIDRVDSYWRKSSQDCEQIIMTTKEPQRIHSQLANLERRNLGLTVDDPELFELLNEQCAILIDHVGDRFKSIHQYIILKAENMEALNKQSNILRMEADESSLVFRGLSQLNKEEVLKALSVLYKGR